MTREELIDKLDGDSERLDELVHELHAQNAADVNNRGVESQVDWLLANGCTLPELEREVRLDALTAPPQE